MFIKRDFSRSEKDDFKLNVEDTLKGSMFNYPVEAKEVFDFDYQTEKVEIKFKLVGWKIQPQYE